MATIAITTRGTSTRKRLIFGVIILIVSMIGGGRLIANMQRVSGAQAAGAAISTVHVTRGTITQAVSGSGSITPDQKLDLEFQTTGVVKEVTVKVGESVKEGQVLVALDDSMLQSKVAEAQASLDSAKATLTQKQNGNATAEEIASAKAAVASAQAAYASAAKDSAAGDSTLRSLKATLDQEQVALQKAQAAYDKIAWRSDVGSSSEAADLQTATIAYEKAKADYEAQLATSGPDAESSIASARATLQQAQASLAALTAPSTESDIAIQQAAVEQAEQALKQAELNLEEATLKAPFDGVITEVDIVPGSAAGSTVMTIMKQDPLHVELKLSESNVVQVETGQVVRLTSDAVSDWSADGTVSYIAPSGTTSNGVVSYLVRVDFTSADSRVRVGMTLNVDITTMQKKDILIVPTSAILTEGETNVVQIIGTDGKTNNIPVRVGISDGTHTEITEGVVEGEEIVALPSSGIVSASSNRPNGGGGLFGMPF